MQSKIPFLKRSTESQQFFDEMEIGDLFEYSMDTYLFSDIEKIAERFGTKIKYCTPGTQDYKTFGCFVCKITGHIEMKPKEILKFDPEELML